MVTDLAFELRFFLAVVEVEISVWGIADRTDDLSRHHRRFAPELNRFKGFAVLGLIQD